MVGIKTVFSRQFCPGTKSQLVARVGGEGGGGRNERGGGDGGGGSVERY